MMISIVIPTYNRKKFLRDCLESLFNQTYPKQQYEIIIVDDGSTDGTQKLIENFSESNLRCFYQKNQGPAAARNLGIKKAKGEIIAFIDSDCVADKDWLVNLVKGFDAGEKIVGVGGKIKVLNPRNLIEKYAEIFLFNHQECIENAKEEPPHMGTLNCAYRTKTIKEIGLFNPLLRCGEDVDLSWRLYFSGYRFSYASKAIIFHRIPKTLGGQLKQGFVYGRAKTTLLDKYKDKLNKNYGPSLGLSRFIFRDLVNLFTLPRRITNRFRKIPAQYRKEKPFWFFILMLFILDILIYQGFRLGMMYQVIKMRRR